MFRDMMSTQIRTGSHARRVIVDDLSMRRNKQCPGI